ncbi:MAG: FKBP-type peptidyl-prolyl cis-trans isomerase [Flavobacteriales bacterium]|nr:FKBP-type peptidyl-prolyl cis-trans isomerase [Flavobacteriales bacterium]
MISQGKTVKVHYILRYDGSDGELIEQTRPEEPLEFVFGQGDMLPKFETALNGLKPNDTFTVFIPAIDAYGEENEEYFREFEKSEFLADEEWDDELFQVGEVIPMQAPDGEIVQGVVAEVKLNSIILDFNHPLAGEDLYFEGQVVGVD